MCRERGLDLGLLQSFGRSVPLHRPEASKLRERDDRGCLPAEMDHLVWLGLFRVASRLDTHTATVPDTGSQGPTTRALRRVVRGPAVAGVRFCRIPAVGDPRRYHEPEFVDNAGGEQRLGDRDTCVDADIAAQVPRLGGDPGGAGSVVVRD